LVTARWTGVAGLAPREGGSETGRAARFASDRLAARLRGAAPVAAGFLGAGVLRARLLEPEAARGPGLLDAFLALRPAVRVTPA
jgi:hypothetical protein